MENERNSRSRLTEELESLRRQIAELRGFVMRPKTGAPGELPGAAGELPSAVPWAAAESSPPSQSGPAVCLPEIFDKGPFAMALVDPEFRVLQANEALCGLLDYPAHEIAGTALSQLAESLDLSWPEEPSGTGAQSGRARRRASLTGRSGIPVSVDFIVYPVSPREGKPDRAILLFEVVAPDSIEAKPGDAADERFRDFFENANDLMYSHDPGGRLTSFNKAAERITGYPAMEALGMNVEQLIGTGSIEAARRQADRQLRGEIPEPYEIASLTKDGRRITLEISSRLIFRGGRPVEFQSAARDVSARKRGEEAVQNANEKLQLWVRELEQRTREMSLLSELADMLRACYNTEEAYSVIIRMAKQMFPDQIGALYVITGSRNLVQAAAVWGDPSATQRTFIPDDCWALRRGRMHCVEDTRSGLLCKHLHTPAPSAYICVPMMAQSEALGILHLTQREDKRLVEAQQRLAVAMAEHIAMALSNLRLHETLRSQSIRDSLTGLFNRRFMEEALELEMRRAARGQHSLGVIMVDLDRFNDFNQKLGRESGDAALREIGSVLQANIRKEDVACRFSGQRFVVILPQSTLEVIRNRAGFLADLVRKTQVRLRNHAAGSVTVSLGVSMFPQHGRTVDAILRAAEAALQRAKEAGGDQVVTAQ